MVQRVLFQRLPVGMLAALDRYRVMRMDDLTSIGVVCDHDALLFYFQAPDVRHSHSPLLYVCTRIGLRSAEYLARDDKAGDAVACNMLTVTLAQPPLLKIP